MKTIEISKSEIHSKGWGREEWIVNNELYCGKLLIFNAGAEFSTHYHLNKHETFYILKGKLLLYFYDLDVGTKNMYELNEGTVVTIPPGNPHRICAVYESIIVEFSTHHEDSDSYRIEPGDSQK